MTTPAPRAPLAFVAARSFWCAAAAAGLSLASAIDPAAVQTLGTLAGLDPEVTAALAQIAAGLGALLAWRERRDPGRRLVLFGPLR